MSRTIYFVDQIDGMPYDARTPVLRATGGTIAAVVTVAEALATTFAVFVIQSETPRKPTGHATYVSPTCVDALPEPDAVVFVRGRLSGDAWSLSEVARRYSRAKLYYWSHLTVPTPFPDISAAERQDAEQAFRSRARLLAAAPATVVCTSRFHCDNWSACLHSMCPDLGHILLMFIYNPVDVPRVDGARTSYDRNKLLYFSGPQRGLRRALELFALARLELPELTLLVASPGYTPLPEIHMDGVIVLGSIPRPSLFSHIRDSLCVFYPNTTVPESFGYVFAESNALGTPVLTHRVGAAAEVLSDSSQLINCDEPRSVINCLRNWQNGARPVVGPREEFSASAVSRRWVELLSGAGPRPNAV